MDSYKIVKHYMSKCWKSYRKSYEKIVIRNSIIGPEVTKHMSHLHYLAESNCDKIIIVIVSWQPWLSNNHGSLALYYLMLGLRLRRSPNIKTTSVQRLVFAGFRPLRFSVVTAKNIQSEFSPTWNCVSLTGSTTSSEWKLFRFDKMEVYRF